MLKYLEYLYNCHLLWRRRHELDVVYASRTHYGATQLVVALARDRGAVWLADEIEERALQQWKANVESLIEELEAENKTGEAQS